MITINLGPDCELAGILKTYKILEARSPFDSVITNHDSLCLCLKEKFEKFIDKNSFKLYFDKQSPVNYYGIVLAHNFKLKNFDQKLTDEELIIESHKITGFKFENNSLAIEYYTKNKQIYNHGLLGGGILDFNELDYNTFQQKYNRRINRFLERANGDQYVYYYRMINNLDEIIEIFNIINEYYINKNFILIGIIKSTNVKQFKIFINNPKILVYNYSGNNEENMFYEQLFLDIQVHEKKYLHYIINSLDNNYLNNIEKLINPLSMYFISDFYFGIELEEEMKNKPKYSNQINNITKTKNLYYNKDLIKKINDYSIIAVQGGPKYTSDWVYNFYYDFVNNILPLINKKIFLIIGHNALTHFISSDEYIHKIIKDSKVILCFLQNYGMIESLLKINKIKAFPFGLCLSEGGLNSYINSLKTYHLKDNKKEKNVEHLYLSISWVGRKIFPIKEKLPHNIFYKKILESKSLLSPCGDRWDTYRHYECIGLETYPICTKGSLSLVFNDSMIYINTNNKIDYNININDNQNDEEKMKYMITLLEEPNETTNFDIFINNIKPNCDIITTDYWKQYIKYQTSLYTYMENNNNNCILNNIKDITCAYIFQFIDNCSFLKSKNLYKKINIFKNCKYDLLHNDNLDFFENLYLPDINEIIIDDLNHKIIHTLMNSALIQNSKYLLLNMKKKTINIPDFLTDNMKILNTIDNYCLIEHIFTIDSRQLYYNLNPYGKIKKQYFINLYKNNYNLYLTQYINMIDVCIVGVGGSGQTYFMDFLNLHDICINSTNNFDLLKHLNNPKKIPSEYKIKKFIYLYTNPLLSFYIHTQNRHDDWYDNQISFLKPNKEHINIKDINKLTIENNKDMFGIEETFDKWYNIKDSLDIYFIDFYEVLNKKVELNNFLNIELNYNEFTYRNPKNINYDIIDKRLINIYDILYKKIKNLCKNQS